MMITARKSPGQGLRGTVLHDEPMAKHTSWRVGGPADTYFVPADRADLLLFLRQRDTALPLTWVGLGSNVLVRDGGIRGIVIATHKCLGSIERRGEGDLYVEAGVPGAKIARYSVRNNLRGAEFFAGIPGTLGGALAMNAGAFGTETWQVVRVVDTVDRDGMVRQRHPSQYRVGYRTVEPPIPGEWFLGARIGLSPGDGEVGKQLIRRLLTKRAQSQPIQIPNAGSVFRNPDNDFAARLIESSGLKGTRRGQAQISERHANFIVNTGNARAADIEGLIEHAAQVVLQQTGVRLEREVHIIGEPL